MTKTEPRFLVDRMLGKVSRWLIILGYDSEYPGPERSDEDLVEQAVREGRILLTRDAKIPEKRGLKKIFVGEQRFEGQLRHVLRETGLTPDRARLFSRCTNCNKALNKISREAALPLVPQLVKDLPTEFFQCGGCRRVYWAGSHTQKTIDKLERVGLLPK